MKLSGVLGFAGCAHAPGLPESPDARAATVVRLPRAYSLGAARRSSWYSIVPCTVKLLRQSVFRLLLARHTSVKQTCV